MNDFPSIIKNIMSQVFIHAVVSRCKRKTATGKRLTADNDDHMRLRSYEDRVYRLSPHQSLDNYSVRARLRTAHFVWKDTALLTDLRDG